MAWCQENQEKKIDHTDIPKHGSIKDISNYRTIKLLTTLSNILEKVYKSVVTFLDNNKILSLTQNAFNKNHGTGDAIAKITKTNIKELDESKKCVALFKNLFI